MTKVFLAWGVSADRPSRSLSFSLPDEVVGLIDITPGSAGGTAAVTSPPSAILDPGLPNGPGLWAVERSDTQREESTWPTSRTDLARCLTFDEWQVVTKPSARVAEIATRFTPDDPDRVISAD